MVNVSRWKQHAKDFWRQPRLQVPLSAEQRYLKSPGTVRIPWCRYLGSSNQFFFNKPMEFADFRSHTTLLLALLLPRVITIRTGRALFPSTRRWVRRFPWAIILLWYLCFSTGTFRFLLFWFWIAIWDFYALQSRTKIRTVTYGATHRSVGSIGIGLLPSYVSWGYENPGLQGQGPETHQHDVDQLWWL